MSDRGANSWPGLASAVNAMVESGWWAHLSPSAAKLWLVLAKRAGPNGRACAGRGRLIAETGLSRTMVWRARSELEDSGLLERAPGKGGFRKDPSATAVYRLCLPETLSTYGPCPHMKQDPVHRWTPNPQGNPQLARQRREPMAGPMVSGGRRTRSGTRSVESSAFGRQPRGTAGASAASPAI